MFNLSGAVDVAWLYSMRPLCAVTVGLWNAFFAHIRFFASVAVMALEHLTSHR